MKKTIRQKFALTFRDSGRLWLLCAAWFVVMFLLSGQDSEGSGQLSGALARTLYDHMPFLRALAYDEFHLLLRKLAHAGGFALGGFFIMLASARQFARGARTVLRVMWVMAAISILNELAQLTAAGRSCEVTDMLIDFGGAAAGVFVALGVNAILRARKKWRAARAPIAFMPERVWKWCCAAEFFKRVPVDVFHRENAADGSAPETDPLANTHMLVRRAFRLARAPKDATLFLTADDCYKLYVNGEYVCQGPAPAYPFAYGYNEIPLDGLLKRGVNVIALDVYYQGLINRVWVSGDARQGFACALRVGGETRLISDQKWKYALLRPAGKKTGYDTLFFDSFDSCLEERGWKTRAFDDFHWIRCRVRKKTDYAFHKQITPCVRSWIETPVLISDVGGEKIYDFGREVYASLLLRAAGEDGARVKVVLAEELVSDDPPVLLSPLRCGCEYAGVWTLSSGESEWAQYDACAFRYLSLTPEAGARLTEVSARLTSYPVDPDACEFDTDDARLKAVFGLCAQTLVTGVQDAYMDCPTRERGQYLGDLTVSSLAHLYLSGDTRLLKKAICDFMASSRVSDALMAVSPCSFMQEIADYSLMFPLIALRHYEHTGDIALLRETYSHIRSILGTYALYSRADGLIENVTEAWNLVDWPEGARDGYDFPLTRPNVSEGCHNVINAWYLGAVGLSERVADILGMKVEKQFARLCVSFHKCFFRPEIGLYADSETSAHCAQHSSILPLYFGIAPPECREKIADALVSGGMRVSVYMAYFYLKALTACGRYEQAYDCIVSDGEHSWGNMLTEGATTAFEAWGKAQKWNTSLCHLWATSPIPILIEDILGITPAVADGQPWTQHLPDKVQYLSLRVRVKGVEFAFLRKNGGTHLTRTES